MNQGGGGGGDEGIKEGGGIEEKLGVVYIDVCNGGGAVSFNIIFVNFLFNFVFVIFVFNSVFILLCLCFTSGFSIPMYLEDTFWDINLGRLSLN